MVVIAVFFAFSGECGYCNIISATGVALLILGSLNDIGSKAALARWLLRLGDATYPVSHPQPIDFTDVASCGPRRAAR
jgi:hypothetical protein